METNALPGAPVPRRNSRPKWLDIRVIGGLVLVVAAVVIGARVVGSSSHTTSVWAASRSLAAGTVLGVTDLVPVDVNLGDGGAHYLAAGSRAESVVGSSLVKPVAAGELVPVSAVGPTTIGRVLVIGVSPDRMPPGVGHGSVIDLYLSSGGKTSAAEVTTVLISAGLTVQSVAAPASGGLSGATSNRYQVAVLVPPPLAGTLVKALSKGDAILVLVAGER